MASAKARAAMTVRAISQAELLVASALALCAVVLLYPLYALQRGQLSLLWSTVTWQFFNRPGSGSLLDSSSFTYNQVHWWVTTDPWLLAAGAITAPFMLFSRRLRPFAFALLLQVAVLVKGDYLPFFYVTAVLPFAALMLGGAADTLWTKADFSRFRALRARRRPLAATQAEPRAVPAGRVRRWTPYLGRVLVVIAALTYAIHVTPEWANVLDQGSKTNGSAPYLAAAAWAEKNVPKGDVVVVDDYLWVDLKTHGLAPLWIWKINGQTAPDGWKSIQYILLQPQSPATLASMPALQGAYAHSVLVRDFGGGLSVRKVVGG